MKLNVNLPVKIHNYNIAGIVGNADCDDEKTLMTSLHLILSPPRHSTGFSF